MLLPMQPSRFYASQKLNPMFSDVNYSQPISQASKQTIKEINYNDLIKVRFIKLLKGVNLFDYNQKEAHPCW